MKSHIVTLEEIKKNEFNLNNPRYISNYEPEEIIDIRALIHGGFPSYDIDQIRQDFPLFDPLLNQIFDKRIDAPYYDLKVHVTDESPLSYKISSMIFAYINDRIPEIQREDAIKQEKRIKVLIDQYGVSLNQLEKDLVILTQKVNGYLKDLGFL